MRYWFTAAALLSFAIGAPAQTRSNAQAKPRAQAATTAPKVDARAFLNEYCVVCHNEKTKTGGLPLDTMDVAALGTHAVKWEEVSRKLRGNLMPPPGMPPG